MRGVVVALVLHQIMAPPGLIIYATQSHMLVTNIEFQSYTMSCQSCTHIMSYQITTVHHDSVSNSKTNS